MTTPKDAVLSIRLSSEDRDALDKIADENDEPVAQTARRAIRAFIATAGVALAVLTLGACGAQDGATLPVAGRTAPSLGTSAPAVPNMAVSEPSVEERAAAGECYSTTVGPNAGILAHMWQALPHVEAPTAERIAALEAMLAAIPLDSEGCEAGDVADLEMYRDSAVMNLTELRSEG